MELMLLRLQVSSYRRIQMTEMLKSLKKTFMVPRILRNRAQFLIQLPERACVCGGWMVERMRRNECRQAGGKAGHEEARRQDGKQRAAAMDRRHFLNAQRSDLHSLSLSELAPSLHAAVSSIKSRDVLKLNCSCEGLERR